MEFDPQTFAFSTFGAWFSVAPVHGPLAPTDKKTGERLEGIYLSALVNRLSRCVRILPMIEGQCVSYDAKAEPAVMICKTPDGGQIRMCFQGPRTLRIEAIGVDIYMDALCLMFHDRPKRVLFNARAATSWFATEATTGTLEVASAWRAKNNKRPRMVIKQVDGCCACTIHHYSESSYKPVQQLPFDEAFSKSNAGFRAFLSTMPSVLPEHREARELAAYVNWSCVAEPRGILQRPVMLMSKSKMCHIWSWDNCFNAMALAPYDAKLAWDQLLVMVDHQDPFGIWPDQMNCIEKQYNFTKPPIHGLTVRLLLERTGDVPYPDGLKNIYTALQRQANWWLNERRMAGNVLPHYLHGNDSGWDNGSMFDEGVPLIGPDLAAFMVLQCDVLAELAERLGRKDEATTWKTQHEALLTALLEELWNGDEFVALAGLEKRPHPSQCLLPCMPLVLGKHLPADVRERTIERFKLHLTAHGPATEQTDSPQYDSNGYWRGPIWAPSTWLMVYGLRQCGEFELARETALRFCNMCADVGFWENYDAIKGKGLCDPGYTWTSSVFLLLAEQLEQEARS